MGSVSSSLALRRGFTLIEVLLVVALLGSVAGIGVPMYRDYQIRNDLNLATEQVTQGLARARLLSQAGQDDDAWGFYAPAGILYKGDSYATRDVAYDETYPMPSTIKIQGLFEVNYSKLNGKPDNTGEITLTTINDDTRNVLIEVKTESIAVVAADRFTICHNPGPNQQTLSIPDNAWPGHQGHGDTFGACVASSSSASSAAASSAPASSAPASSAPASSAPASSAAPSSSASSAGPLCNNYVQVDADGTIEILNSLSVTFKSYGAQFGYGNGGPDVPVYVSYRKKNGGAWSDLFNGAAINGTGGPEQTVTGFSAANNKNRLYVQFHAYYYQSRWLTYENYGYSNGHPEVLFLYDGDTPPSIPAGNGQYTVSQLLAPLVDPVAGVIDIGAHDVVMVVDFNRESCSSCSGYYCSNCDGVDYQDGVVLVHFNTPSC